MNPRTPRVAVSRPRSRRRVRAERGVVALEYILIAALIGLATVGSFAYLRNKVRSAVRLVATHASESAVGSYYNQ